MTRALAFSHQLVAWQAIHGRHNLPWTQSLDDTASNFAYRVWLSEVMLQQTQVKTVIPYFNQFQTRFPTVFDLAQADMNEVLSLWAGLGYYSRARYLHRSAQIIVQRHNGIMPSNLNDLMALPGVGASTAAAILSLGYQQRAAILDGNVKRVLARHAGVVGWAGTPAVMKQLWQVAHTYLIQPDANVPSEHHRRYTQGLMDLGAMVCHKRQPDCRVCPVATACYAFEKGVQNDIPEPRPKRVLPIHKRNALVVHDDKGVWLLRREPKGLWGGLLSFLEADDYTDLCSQAFEKIQCLHRPLLIKPWHIPVLKHTFTHYQLHWTVWDMYINSDDAAQLKLPESWEYVAWNQLAFSGVPKAVLKVLANQMNELKN